jgi:hypothetical protein
MVVTRCKLQGQNNWHGYLRKTRQQFDKSYIEKVLSHNLVLANAISLMLLVAKNADHFTYQ